MWEGDGRVESALLTWRLRDSGTRRMAKPGGWGGREPEHAGGCNPKCGEKLAKLAPGTPGTSRDPGRVYQLISSRLRHYYATDDFSISLLPSGVLRAAAGRARPSRPPL